MQSTRAMQKWADLEQFGIMALTTESCGVNMRMLCDLTKNGCLIIKDLFGLQHGHPDHITFQDPWNSKGVASVMLPMGILPELMAFCLLRQGWPTILKFNDCVMAVDMEAWKKEMEDPDLKKWDLNLNCMGPVQRQWTQIGEAFGSGMRCRHGMTGRIN